MTNIRDKKAASKRPVKTAGYTHAKLDARRALRRKQAEARQAEYDATPEAMKPVRDRFQRQEWARKCGVRGK